MRCWIFIFALPSLVWAESERGPMPRLLADFDIADYKTVDRLQTTMITPPKRADVTPYLGVQFAPQGKGLHVAQLDPQSPAATVLRPGDTIVAIDGKPYTTETLRGLLNSKNPGDKLALKFERDGNNQEATLTLSKATAPFTGTEADARPAIGVITDSDAKGMKIRDLSRDSAAQTAGLKIGDVLLQVNGRPTLDLDQITDAFNDKRPGDTIKVLYLREGKEATIDVKLTAATPTKRGFGGGGGPPDAAGNWDTRTRRTFQRPVFKLAVIPISFTDVPASTKITPKDWENALFSKGTFTDKNATGRPVYGSMHDYYFEQSCGKLSIEGKCFTSVKLNKKRSDYSETSQRQAFFRDTFESLAAREGANALKGFDGIFFLYAGNSATTSRSNLYWPHQSSTQFAGESWRYFICPEGTDNMATISTSCHEFGHMLGLPDLYAKPEVQGMEGVGAWCAMSNQVGTGRPQHFGAWSKEQMKWVTPTVIDPTVPQKIILSPIEGTTDQLIKVLVRPDASEYFLLEVRKKTGFDKSVPAEGLLIWRVVDGRPVLEEAHGIAGPNGPRRYLESVPFPSRANRSFTPFTIPSSESIKGNGKPVFITNIRKLTDGRVAFQIGYEFY